MNRLMFGLVAIIAIAVGLLVGTLNSDRVTLDLLWIQIQWPLGLLILLSLCSGLLLGIILIYFSQVFPLRLKLRKSQAQIVRVENREVASIDD
jgi:putative membrane protein